MALKFRSFTIFVIFNTRGNFHETWTQILRGCHVIILQPPPPNYDLDESYMFFEDHLP